ncbi:MAG TPA: hypothetical protein VK392_06310, partial [Thermoanaerobaculia bacterium]|nr:hypothetical protein [Thermoanaerobaculia bacterium]
MRSFRLSGCLVAAALVSFVGCASRKLPLPTFEDYSDRVSTWAERFLEDWKNGAEDPTLYASEFRWSGPLPGDESTDVPARAPLTIRMYRPESAPSPPSSLPRGDGSRQLRRRLAEIRSRFTTLGRTENTIFEFLRRGERREVVLALLLTGRSADGALLQEGGKVHAML